MLTDPTVTQLAKEGCGITDEGMSCTHACSSPVCVLGGPGVGGGGWGGGGGGGLTDPTVTQLAKEGCGITDEGMYSCLHITCVCASV